MRNGLFKEPFRDSGERNRDRTLVGKSSCHDETPPTDSLLLALLAVYRTARMVGKAEQLVKVQSRGVSNKVWNALLQVCVESKDVETAKRIMEDSIRTQKNVYQATTFSNCLLASHQRTTTVGPQPDSYVVWTVMKACQDDFPMAIRILQAVEDGTLPISLTEDHYNCVLSSCDYSTMAEEPINFQNLSRLRLLDVAIIGHNSAAVIQREGEGCREDNKCHGTFRVNRR